MGLNVKGLRTLTPRVQAQGNRLPTLVPGSWRHDRIRGRALMTLRARHFRENPLCVMCLENNRVTLAAELDHIVALTNGGTNDDDNYQGLCRPCHEAKTLADLGIKSDAFTFRGPRWRLAERAPVILKQQHEFSELRFPSDITASRIPCVMVCGPPNGGTHPYVSQHAGRNDVAIDLDQITHELSGQPVWEAGIEWLPKALAERNKRLRALACDANHANAWFIINAPDPDERRLWTQRLGATAVILAPPLEECIRRIEAEQYSGRYTERMLDAAKHWWEANQDIKATLNQDGFWIVD